MLCPPHPTPSPPLPSSFLTSHTNVPPHDNHTPTLQVKAERSRVRHGRNPNSSRDRFPGDVQGGVGRREVLKSRSKAGIDILGIIEEWSEVEKGRAYEVIADFEREGLERLQIMPGALELCRYLDAKKIRRGMITRNVKAAVDIFHQHFGMNFSPALGREFRPYKPDPGPLLHICSTWEVQAHEVLMIGDSLKDDVACGNRAGAFACLVDVSGKCSSPGFVYIDHKPDFKVSSVAEVRQVLETNFDLLP